jgi:hypothetical protein
VQAAHMTLLLAFIACLCLGEIPNCGANRDGVVDGSRSGEAVPGENTVSALAFTAVKEMGYLAIWFGPPHR